MNRRVPFFSFLLAGFVAATACAGPLQPLHPGQVTLSGEFGRRFNGIIESNVLKVDMEASFLQHFRAHNEETAYYGFGKCIDGVVRLAAWSDDARMLALKKRIIGELIATQGADGYIGWARPDVRVKAWPAGYFHFCPHDARLPLVLTEFPDAGGVGIYFIVPNTHSPLISDDELTTATIP